MDPMTQCLAPALRLAWSFPLVTEFFVALACNRVVGCLYRDGIVGLDPDGMNQWHVRNDVTGRLHVRDEEAYITGNGFLYCINIVDGRQRSLPILGSVIFVSEDRKTLMFRRSENKWDTNRYFSSIGCRLILEHDGNSLWEHQNEGPMAGSTAFGTAFTIDSGSLFIARQPARLVRIDVKSGVNIWNADLNESKPEPDIGVPADLRVAPLVSGNIVLAPTPFGFGAFSVETGELWWPHHVHAGPFNIHDDRLYMATGINFTGYRVVDMKTGEMLFERQVSEDIAKKYGFGYVKLNSGFAITETHTFVGDNFGRLWALERDTGEPVWYHHPKNAASYVALRQPVISGNRLYINSFSTDPKRPQQLYCYEQA